MGFAISLSGSEFFEMSVRVLNFKARKYLGGLFTASPQVLDWLRVREVSLTL